MSFDLNLACGCEALVLLILNYYLAIWLCAVVYVHAGAFSGTLEKNPKKGNVVHVWSVIVFLISIRPIRSSVGRAVPR